ncbi:MAG: HipA N-terminal domain-containing protein [Bacteroidales bacterium]|nr:HipA N-terminal domain-containing protein [Bacteroidales bacterium]
MRQVIVNVNRVPAGLLQETDQGKYKFQYYDTYLNSEHTLAVSITLPKRKEPYFCDSLFPCFFNLLSEGANKAMQCRILHIDENDYFGLLMATAQTDSIGALTFTPIE